VLAGKPSGLIATAGRAGQGLRTRTPSLVVIGIGVLGLLGAAGAGGLGLVSASIVGWSSLVALVLVCAASWRGPRTIPIALLVLGWVAAGWTVLGQGVGGGLSGRQVDGFMLAAEVSLILSAITVPLLLKGPPRGLAILVGPGATVVSAGAFVSGSSTLSILVLWNLGVPGWLPGLAYSLALGSLVATIWSAFSSGQRSAAIGLMLLSAGGIGTISTYQTGLVLTAVLLLGSTVLTTDPDPTGPVPNIRTGESLSFTPRPSRGPARRKPRLRSGDHVGATNSWKRISNNHRAVPDAFRRADRLLQRLIQGFTLDADLGFPCSAKRSMLDNP